MLRAGSAISAGRLTRIHRALLRTQGGRLRPLWRLGYAGAVRTFSAYLRAGAPGAATYVGGSLGTGQPVYGLADLDLAVVVAPNGAAGQAAARVRGRWSRLSRAVPLLDNVVDCCVYEDPDLREALRDSTITYGLEAPNGGRPPAVYHGPLAGGDAERLLERPELYGPTAAWRRVAGPERRPPEPDRDPQRRRIAAWLELQFLWRLAVELCLNPGRPGAASVCVKLVAEPARMWIWLTEGRRTQGRERTLIDALARLPEEAAALEPALALQRAIATAPEPPVAECLASFLRLSIRLAERITAEVAGAGTTEVALLGAEDDLILPHGELPAAFGPTEPALLPLADWRAVVQPDLPDPLAHPDLPDAAFALVPGDPGDPGDLARAAQVTAKGPYPTLTSPGLQIRPFHGGRARLRAVQCAVTDPASFALAAGRTTAAFPAVLGWSARDTARRAVAEYGAALAEHPAPPEPSGPHLGRLFGAARAALFAQSLDDGRPELPLSAAATARALADRVPGAGAAAEAGLAAYRRFAEDWRPPDRSALTALDACVRALPAHAA